MKIQKWHIKTLKVKDLLMKNTLLYYFFAGMVILAFSSGAHADSLWKKRITANSNMFTDNRARCVGDIVTVIINESTAITGTEDSSADSQSSHSVAIDSSQFLTKPMSNITKNIGGYMPNLTADSSHGFSGQGAYESNRNINLELTAVVTEILSNGNLIIEGNRDVNINDEKYNIKVSGIVRPIDITIANVVLSSAIANANIILEGKGFLTRAGKRGWWNRVVEVVWPF